MIRLAPKAHNFWNDMVLNGCSRPLWVYFATALPAWIEAAVILTIPFLDDIIRDVAEVEASFAGRKARRGLTHRFKRELGAERLPDERISHKGLRTVLRFTQPIETAGFIFLAYSAGDHFFFRWQSLIVAFSACDPNDPDGSFQRSAVNAFWDVGPEGRSAVMQQRDENTLGWTETAFSVTLPPGDYFVSFSATLQAQGSDVDGVGIQVRRSGPFGGSVNQSGTQTITKGQGKGFVVGISFLLLGFTDTNLTWEVYGPAVPVGVLAEKGHIAVWRRRVSVK